MVIIVIDGTEQKIVDCSLENAVEALGISEDSTIKVNDVEIPITSTLNLNENHRVVINSPAYQRIIDGVEDEPVEGESDGPVIRMMVYKSKTVQVNDRPKEFDSLPPKRSLRRVVKILDLNPKTGETNEVWANS